MAERAACLDGCDGVVRNDVSFSGADGSVSERSRVLGEVGWRATGVNQSVVVI